MKNIQRETPRKSVSKAFCEQKITSPRPSDEMLQESWKHATKTGARDMRYKDNIRASLVQWYGVTLHHAIVFETSDEVRGRRL
jgi:hypothetical protein